MHHRIFNMATVQTIFYYIVPKRNFFAHIYTTRYETECLACADQLMESQLNPPHGTENRNNQTRREYKHSLTFRVRRCCHSNETRAPIANPPNTIPLTYMRVRAVVWQCGGGQTDTQTTVTNIHFASATPYAKCNNPPALNRNR